MLAAVLCCPCESGQYQKNLWLVKFNSDLCRRNADGSLLLVINFGCDATEVQLIANPSSGAVCHLRLANNLPCGWMPSADIAEILACRPSKP